MIAGGTYERTDGGRSDLFVIEDVVLVESVERFTGYFR